MVQHDSTPLKAEISFVVKLNEKLQAETGLVSCSIEQKTAVETNRMCYALEIERSSFCTFMQMMSKTLMALIAK